MILLLAQEIPGSEIPRRTGYTPVQVSRLRRLFSEERLESLRNRPRSGQPREITARKIAKVVARTLRPPPRGLSHWTVRELAHFTGVAPRIVQRIWKAQSFKPHRLETFKFTTDPQAEETIRDVIGLYLNPPANAAVISLDEKTQIQALNRTQPLLPLQSGLPARRTHDYQRNGLISLFAALDIERRKVLGEYRARHTGADFLSSLKKVARHHRGELHMIPDSSSTHKTPEVQTWLQAHPRVHFHITPTGATWLNLIEAWFSALIRKSICRGSFDIVRQLIRHIEAYIRHWNEAPVPFV